MRGRKWRFCASVPKAINTGPIMLTLKDSGSGAGAMCSSSLKMYCFTALQPVPPHCGAQAGVAQPRANKIRVQRTSSSRDKRCPNTHLRGMSGGSAVRKNCRTSSRKAISSSVNLKSISFPRRAVSVNRDVSQ